MDGWIVKCRDQQTSMNGWIETQKDGLMERQIDIQINVWRDRWIERHTDAWIQSDVDNVQNKNIELVNTLS